VTSDNHRHRTGIKDRCELLAQGGRFHCIEPTEIGGRAIRSVLVTGIVDAAKIDVDCVDSSLTKPVSTRALHACVDAVLSNRSARS